MAAPLWLPEILKFFFPYRRHLARLSRLPIIAWMMDKTIFNGDDIIYLPKDRVVIQETIEQPGSIALPSTVVDHFIEKASHRWIMNACICREGDDCQDYPKDLGCVFLGEAVLSINPKLGRLVSKEEALAHVHRARELGMVQLIGRDRLDSYWMGAHPFGKLMTICNCCPCCCLFRVLPDLDEQNAQKIHRMAGVTVSVSEACIGCGKCTRGVCFVEAIHLSDGKAEIGSRCVACGRCVEACPQHVIHLSIEDTSYVQQAVAKISDLVDVGVSQPVPSGRAKARRARSAD